MDRNYHFSQGGRMDVRQSMTKHMDDHKITIVLAAKGMSISPATLGLWLKEKYAGDNVEVERKVTQWLKLQNARHKIAGRKFQCVKTLTSGKIFETLHLCHVMQRPGVIIGPFGCGKTVSIKEWIKHNSDAILLEADTCYTVYALLAELHSKVTVHQGKESLRYMFNDIVSKLKGSGRIIIVDEAEYLPKKALDQLRRIGDHAEIGYVLVGHERLEGNLRGNCGELAMIHNRVQIRVRLSEIKESDATSILSTIIPGQEHSFMPIYNRARGCARSIALMADLASHIAKMNRSDIDDDILDRAERMMMI
jgi:DNA transposition AAA+ family ATPase